MAGGEKPASGLEFSSRPRPRGDLPSEKYDGETIIVEPESSTMHALTGVGPFLWERMDGETTLAELAEALVEHFEIELQAARADVLAFARELEAQGLFELDRGAEEGG